MKKISPKNKIIGFAYVGWHGEYIAVDLYEGNMFYYPDGNVDAVSPTLYEKYYKEYEGYVANNLPIKTAYEANKKSAMKHDFKIPTFTADPDAAAKELYMRRHPEEFRDPEVVANPKKKRWPFGKKQPKELLICPKCGAANDAGKKFCGECGMSLAKKNDEELQQKMNNIGTAEETPAAQAEPTAHEIPVTVEEPSIQSTAPGKEPEPVAVGEVPEGPKMESEDAAIKQEPVQKPVQKTKQEQKLKKDDPWSADDLLVEEPAEEEKATQKPAPRKGQTAAPAKAPEEDMEEVPVGKPETKPVVKPVVKQAEQKEKKQEPVKVQIPVETSVEEPASKSETISCKEEAAAETPVEKPKKERQKKEKRKKAESDGDRPKKKSHLILLFPAILLILILIGAAYVFLFSGNAISGGSAAPTQAEADQAEPYMAIMFTKDLPVDTVIEKTDLDGCILNEDQYEKYTNISTYIDENGQEVTPELVPWSDIDSVIGKRVTSDVKKGALVYDTTITSQHVIAQKTYVDATVNGEDGTYEVTDGVLPGNTKIQIVAVISTDGADPVQVLLSEMTLKDRSLESIFNSAGQDVLEKLVNGSSGDEEAAEGTGEETQQDSEESTEEEQE